MPPHATCEAIWIEVVSCRATWPVSTHSDSDAAKENNLSAAHEQEGAHMRSASAEDFGSSETMRILNNEQ